MVCEELDSFLSREEEAREEVRVRKQEENVRDKSCKRNVGARERGEPGGSYRKCLDPMRSQKIPKVSTAKQSVNSQPWAPDSL